MEQVCGSCDIEAQAHGVAHCRHFPEHVVGVCACLMELQVGGAHFMGRRGSWPHGDEDKKKQSEPEVASLQLSPISFSFLSSFSVGGSILTL